MKLKQQIVGKRQLRMAAGALLVCAAVAWSDEARLFLPLLRPGQMLKYRSSLRIERTGKTESRVATMLQTPDYNQDLSGEMQILMKQIRIEKGRPILSARANWISSEATHEGQSGKNEVDFQIASNGSLVEEKGLEGLQPEERVAWEFWLGRFAFGLALPADGVKIGDSWKTKEDETVASPIAGLYWEKETTYEQDDACPALPAEMCAVFLTEATLKQKSSPKDSTPEDYRARDLKTMGSVKGANHTITYISLKTGLLARATEDAEQEMDVVILKADGSNGVHYKLGATSHQETVIQAGKE